MRVPAPWGSRQCSCTAASGRSLALTLPETGRADGPRGLPRRGEETAPPVGTTRRAVHGGATGGGDPRVRLTGCGPRAAAVDAVTPGVYRPRGLDGCVATFKKRPENSWSSRPGSVSCSHFEQLVDELNLLPNIRTVQAPRLPLPDHVHGLVSLDRSPRRVEFTKALLGRHASFDRAPSCAGSPAGRIARRRARRKDRKDRKERSIHECLTSAC